MNRVITILAALLCMFSIDTFAQKASNLRVAPDMHIYGVAMILNDSIAYMTEVVSVNEAWENKKNHFLYARNEYSYQFHDYLEVTGKKNPMTSVTFSRKKSKIEKKYLKTKMKLAKSGYTIVYVPKQDFSFRAVPYSAPEYSE